MNVSLKGLILLTRIKRFCYDKFNPNFVYTIGMEMGHKTVEVFDKRVKVTVFDTYVLILNALSMMML